MTGNRRTSVDPLTAVHVPADTLSSTERLRRTFSRDERPDRVPVLPSVGGFATRNCGWSIADYYRDATRSYRAQARTREQYGYDATPGYGYGTFGGWELGGEIRWPDGNLMAPEVRRYPVEDLKDVDGLTVPQNVATVGAVPLMLEMAELQDAAGLPVSVQLGAPLTRAGNVVRPETLLRWILREPSAVHEILRTITGFLLSVARLFADRFPGRRLIAVHDAPLESADLLSDRHFGELVRPYLDELYRGILELGYASSSTHLCGDHTSRLAAWASLPHAAEGEVGAVSLDESIDLAGAIEVFGDRLVVVGNVDTSLVLTGPAEDLYERARDAVLIGREAPVGYALALGCELPVDTPPYHLHLLVKAARVFGRYG